MHNAHFSCIPANTMPPKKAALHRKSNASLARGVYSCMIKYFTRLTFSYIDHSYLHQAELFLASLATQRENDEPLGSAVALASAQDDQATQVPYTGKFHKGAAVHCQFLVLEADAPGPRKRGRPKKEASSAAGNSAARQGFVSSFAQHITLITYYKFRTSIDRRYNMQTKSAFYCTAASFVCGFKRTGSSHLICCIIDQRPPD